MAPEIKEELRRIANELPLNTKQKVFRMLRGRFLLDKGITKLDDGTKVKASKSYLQESFSDKRHFDALCKTWKTKGFKGVSEYVEEVKKLSVMLMKQETMWNDTNRPPNDGRQVKVLLSCDNDKLSLPITEVGHYQYGSWIVPKRPGNCWKVLKWAELDSDTENQSTETL